MTDTRSMPAITQGLRALADFLDDNPDLIAARHVPEQGTEVLFIVPSRDIVVALAAQTGAPFEERVDSDGDTHTTTDVGFGTGSQDWGSSAYTNAVTLRVVHIEDNE